MPFTIALIVSYLIGAIPTAYLLTTWAKGIDIRTVGSGNVGATNVLRTVGLWAGILVLVIDVLKGTIAAGLMPRWVLGTTAPSLSLACGLAAVLGHDFSCFLRFRGGKGVATTMGALLASAPRVAGVVAGVWLMVFLGFRYVSLGSLSAAVAIPISQLVLHRSLGEVLSGSCLSVLIIVRHRANLRRLLSGTEHRAWPRSSA